MRRATRQRLLLLVGVAALLAVAAWQWQRDDAAAPGTLLSLDPDSISQVELALQGHPAEHYVHRQGHWWQVDGGTPRRADDGRLAELARLAAAPVANWRPASDFDPKRIGLTPPNAVLTLDGHAMAFGGTSATGPMTYVRVGQRIAMVSVRDTPRPARADTIKAD